MDDDVEWQQMVKVEEAVEEEEDEAPVVSQFFAFNVYTRKLFCQRFTK